MKTVYFVAFTLFNNIHNTHAMFSSIIHNAENKYDALGQALNEVNVGPSLYIADYIIEGFDPTKVGKTDAERQIEIAEETFFILLEISSMTIEQKIHATLIETNPGNPELPNKIPAIKFLREHLKPFIGLKSCKEIVEFWISEIQDDMPKTPLTNLVRMKMGYPIQ